MLKFLWSLLKLDYIKQNAILASLCFPLLSGAISSFWTLGAMLTMIDKHGRTPDGIIYGTQWSFLTVAAVVSLGFYYGYKKKATYLFIPWCQFKLLEMVFMLIFTVFILKEFYYGDKTPLIAPVTVIVTNLSLLFLVKKLNFPPPTRDVEASIAATISPPSYEDSERREGKEVTFSVI